MGVGGAANSDPVTRWFQEMYFHVLLLDDPEPLRSFGFMVHELLERSASEKGFVLGPVDGIHIEQVPHLGERVRLVTVTAPVTFVGHRSSDTVRP